MTSIGEHLSCSMCTCVLVFLGIGSGLPPHLMCGPTGSLPCIGYDGLEGGPRGGGGGLMEQWLHIWIEQTQNRWVRGTNPPSKHLA